MLHRPHGPGSGYARPSKTKITPDAIRLKDQGSEGAGSQAPAPVRKWRQ